MIKALWNPFDLCEWLHADYWGKPSCYHMSLVSASEVKMSFVLVD